VKKVPIIIIIISTRCLTSKSYSICGATDY